ncbi:MAG: hypothetical protein HGB03_04075 [Candidatus Yonathbacteria bacterium]|nr:hypothetical protein [Candidatus Yonathbacteria bacterium]NTW47592.1 hypothetical protein [Candidatus Yonathbacteria bacterium]
MSNSTLFLEVFAKITMNRVLQETNLVSAYCEGSLFLSRDHAGLFAFTANDSDGISVCLVKYTEKYINWEFVIIEGEPEEGDLVEDYYVDMITVNKDEDGDFIVDVECANHTRGRTVLYRDGTLRKVPIFLC